MNCSLRGLDSCRRAELAEECARKILAMHLGATRVELNLEVSGSELEDWFRSIGFTPSQECTDEGRSGRVSYIRGTMDHSGAWLIPFGGERDLTVVVAAEGLRAEREPSTVAIVLERFVRFVRRYVRMLQAVELESGSPL